MNLQADRLRAAAPASTGGRAPLALVTGGKGGVGKSTLAVNLGAELSRRGQRVLLVDLDLALANCQVLLRAEPTLSLVDVASGQATAREAVVSVGDGLDLLGAGSGEHDLARPDSARRKRILAEIDALRGEYDLVLADSAAGIGPDVLGFASVADHVLLVTTPDPAALTDAYGLLKAYDRVSRDDGLDLPTPELVVNAVGDPDQARRVAERLAQVAQRFLARRPRCVGQVPRSREVAGACADQRPFVRTHPQGAPARAVAGIADRYLKLIEVRRRLAV